MDKVDVGIEGRGGGGILFHGLHAEEIGVGVRGAVEEAIER